MPKLTDALIQLIQRQINERGIVVWYDPDQAYTQAVDGLRSGGSDGAEIRGWLFPPAGGTGGLAGVGR